MDDIAAKAKVSRSTVSRALNGDPRISPETAEKIREIARKYNYRMNASARALARRRTESIGLVIPHVTEAFFFSIVRGVEEETKKHGYSLVLQVIPDRLKSDPSAIQLLTERRVDGLVIITFVTDRQLIHKAYESKMPLVLFGDSLPSLEADAVQTDNKAGGYRAAAYLIELGHKDIGIVLGPEVSEDSALRFEGFRQALTDHGIRLENDWVVRGNYDRESGYRAGKYLLGQRQRPTAVFACNDWMALGVLTAAREMGVKVPNDLSVIGFDDILIAEHVFPPLTTIRQPTYEMGAVAARLLVERIEKPDTPYRTIMVQTELVVRDTTRPLGG